MSEPIHLVDIKILHEKSGNSVRIIHPLGPFLYFTLLAAAGFHPPLK